MDPSDSLYKKGVSMKSVFSGKSTWAFCLSLVAAYAVFLIPADAYAATATISWGASANGGGVIGGLLCNVAKWFSGPVGKGIATLAIIVIGVGALMGKVSWGMAIIVGVGIAVIFGAPTIVSELGGTAEGCV